MDNIEVMLNIIIFFVASPGYCITVESSLGRQQYFKKMSDCGKHVKIRIEI